MTIKKKRSFFSFRKKIVASPTDQHTERFYYEQIAKSVGAGGWTIDFVEKISYFDKQLYEMLEAPASYKPSLKHALDFFDKEFHDVIIQEFNILKKGNSTNGEVKMITFQDRVFWAKVIGTPIYGSNKKIIGVRGVILDIDENKKKEIATQNSIEVVKANNERIFKFANYVSRNLKQHVNNLDLTSQLFDEDTLTNDHKELINNYKETSVRLANTVSQLNEVVSIQKRASEELETIVLEEALERSKNTLHEFIDSNEAYIYSDFSEAPEILYIKDFMENILTTLIKNGIKSQHPDRTPEVKIYSLDDGGKISIVVEDNGTGNIIEEDENIYYTNSKKTSNVGRSQAVGFFIAKNQIEALGGTIESYGKPGYGSKITLRLM